MKLYDKIVSIKVNDGLLYNLDSPCHLFKKEDLNILKSAIENTLSEYEKRGLSEEYINELISKKEAEVERCYQEHLRKRKEENSCKSYLYLIKDKDLNRLKIGKTVNPKSRLKQLQCASSNKFEMLFAIPNIGYMEKDVHKMLAKFKTNGEWFVNDKTIINYFEKIANER